MDILEKIVQNDGSCTGWASESICKTCPLSKLKQKKDGNHLSCIEALGVQELSEEEADAKYKEVASRLLVNAIIDDLLTTDEDGGS